MTRPTLIATSLLCMFAAAPACAQFAEVVTADNPVAYWRFDATGGKTVRSAAGELKLDGTLVGNSRLAVEGPRPPQFPDFADGNRAAEFDGNGDYIKVADPGPDSPLDFALGDSITLEAWVRLDRISANQQVYVVGKGRTNNAGVARENQNYSLRLRCTDGGGLARLSFLFRDADNRPAGHAETAQDWHRWTSDAHFIAGTGWHHIAVTYTFGQGDSVRGYLDGQPTAGSWDMGGQSDEAPVVDDDELWIGSSLGGSAGCTFDGAIDEVVLYRAALSQEQLQRHYHAVPVKVEPIAEPGPGEVVAELIEGVPQAWTSPTPPAREYFVQDAFAFVGVPRKYSAKAVIIDRTNPFLLRATGNVTLAKGSYQVLLRSMGSARLYVDGKLLLQTAAAPPNASGHEHVPEEPKAVHPDLRPLPVGHCEALATAAFDGAAHEFRLESIVGGKSRRPEVGEFSVSVAREGGPFYLLSDEREIPHTDEAWLSYARGKRHELRELNAATRRRVGAEEAEYWQARHELARQHVAERPPLEVPAPVEGLHASNAVDRFINHRLHAAGAQPAPLTDDLAFLRRLTLDTVGVIPTPAEIERYLADPADVRRERAIDRLLDDSRWADHWVSYWQDVLAENPGILKPKLNNTGPFRWWIRESLEDNKPLDRFVTELVMMEGSRYGGGPAGFEMATQNDVPMAAKAHVLAKAFLGVELRCARCHDAPYHPFKQQDTFALAAMLARAPQKVPATSSINLAEATRRPLVQVTLKPGATVQPGWPFQQLATGGLPREVLRSSSDDRERLAAVLTGPENERFAQVMVNRLWHRYLGRGLVEPVDDWHDAQASHPELLDWLARELTAHGYDTKHVARLIFASRAYQRQVTAGASQALFAAPARRRMAAEQVVDSLFSAVGKRFASEELTLDPDNRRPLKDFLNLGYPERSWEFASLSNERDRPALALPVTRSIVDVLATFGWRPSRQDPLTEREGEPTVLQPLILANGIVTNRVTRLSDDSTVTALCLQDRPLEELVEAVYLQLLTRRPSADERAMFVDLLSEGYDQRRVDAPKAQPRRRPRSNVSWSNHLSPEATRIKLALERAAREGDPPTPRLRADWRERMEDMLWALVNTPEFVFVP